MRALALLLFSLAPLAPAHPSVQDDAPCKVHGRFVDAQGAPVADVTLKAHGWGANRSRVQAHGQPKDWKDPEPVTSDADGEFELSFVPPPAFQFALDASHPDYGKVAWRWSEIAPSTDVDLGVTRLEAPAIVVGHVVDGEGNLLVEGWSVSVSHSWSGGGNRVPRPRSSCTSRASIDPATGAFRIDDLPPGRLRLSAENRSGVHVGEIWVDTRAGVENEVELVYDGPDPSRRIVLSIRTPFFGLKPAPGTVHAVDLDGTRYALEPAPGRASDWHVIDLEPGAYTMEVKDPRFEPWESEGVHTGTKTIAQLQGSATVQLTVRPSAGAPPFEAYGLLVTYEGVSFSPNTYTLAEEGAKAPKDGIFTGVVPGDLTLEVRAEGAAPRLVQLGTVKPGETRSVDVTLGSGRVVEGRVLNADGAPAAGVRVQLTRGEFPGTDQPGSMSSGMTRVDGVMKQYSVGYRDHEVETDAEGRFRFAELSTGPHALRAMASPWAVVDQVVDTTQSDAREVELRLPALGAIELEVVLPEGVDATEITVQAQPKGATFPGLPGFMTASGSPALDADGRALLEHLPAGEVELSLTCPDRDADRHPAFVASRTVRLGTLTLEPGKRLAHTFDATDQFPSAAPAPREPQPDAPAATLELAVTFPEGEDATVWRVNVSPADEKPEGLVVTTGTDGTALDSQGRAVLEDVAPGDTKVLLRWQKWGHGRPPETKTIELGVLTLVSGERLVHAVDVRAKMPAAIELSVTCAGGTPNELWVHLEGSQNQTTRRPHAVMRGEGLIEDVVPGEYALRVKHSEAGWSWRAPEPITVAPGSALEHELAVPLVTRELRAVDADGAPLAGVELTWWAEGMRPGRAKAKTNEHGVLSLKLPPGAYRVARADALEQAVELQWKAGEGALEVVLTDPGR